jgi:cation diffusion facilitator CzcD-associated flavoprotein CzcO
MTEATLKHHKALEVLVIGAGFGGLGAAIQLQNAGIDDFVILERADDIGGTWRDNQYPGAACDIPSTLYSYAFAPKHDWPSAYAGSKDIWAYMREVAARHQLAPKLRLRQDVTRMAFDESLGQWAVHTAQGDVWHARSVIMASGGLANPSYPNIPGVESFAGHRIHSARWDHAYDFAGKRVGVIGTGASAVQVIPELVKVAAQVKVFQRTPAWVMPKMRLRLPDWARSLLGDSAWGHAMARGSLFWGHEAMALGLVWRSPLSRLLEWRAAVHLKRQVKEPWLRRQLTPNFKIGCKRVLISNHYYPALQRPNCKLLSWPIDRIAPGGIRTVEGVEHQLDCIVFATGFDAPKAGTPFEIKGLNGRVLADEWRGGAQAFKSVHISGYPNLSMILGPNSGPGHNSALFYIEAQIGYAVQAVQALRAVKQGQDEGRFFDVRADVQRRHNEDLQRRLARTNWNSGCKSWYLTEAGFNATMYPGFATQFARQLARFDLADYRSAATPDQTSAAAPDASRMTRPVATG